MKLSLPSQSPMMSSTFTYGVATASFQIEGGAESRLPCIWDTFCNQPGNIKDQSNGLIACDHFNRWEQDIELIASLGVDAYRFSVSWPRVICLDGSINQSGMDFYLRILDRLEQLNIKAFVTLYHWDLPQHIEDKGGWLNRETAYHFQEYVEKVIQCFGDRVYSYATLNEPFCSAYLGYERGIHAPGIVGKAFGKKAAHHLLLAHGLAMKVLNEKSPKTENGIVLNFTPCYPATNSEEDIEAAQSADDHFNQWFIKPILEADYPALLKNLPLIERPNIEPGDLDIIATPIDYLGINYYTRQVYKADAKTQFAEVAPVAPLTDIGWEIYPQGFTELLVSLNSRYQLPPVYITENGAATDDIIINGEVNDVARVEYLQSHLNAVDNAMRQGLDIRGYFAWSLMDNFEWAEGYAKRFGLVYVDYPEQTRTIKMSGLAYRDLISQRR